MFDYTEDWEHQATDTDEQDDSTFKSPRFIDSPNSKLQEFNTKISAPPVLKKKIKQNSAERKSLKSLKTPPKATPPQKLKRKTKIQEPNRSIKESQFEELVKIMQVADERKESVISLQTEIHDLKRENKLQQRIISQFEREQKQVPEFLHALGDEIRVIKAERRGHLEKIKNQEKASRQALEERMKLQEQVAKLQGILKSKGLHNVQKLKDEIQSLTQLQQTYATEIAEFRKKANNVDNEYILEIRNLKKEIGKLQRDFHTLTSQYEESIEEVKVKTRKIAELSIYAQSNRLQKRISGTSKEVKEEEDKTAENDSNKQHPDFTPRKIGRSQTSDIEIKQKNPAVPKNNSQKPPMPETKKEKKITQVAHQTPDFSTSFKPLSELATDEASNAFKPNLFKQSDDTLKFDPPPQVKQDADDNFKATAAAPFKPTLTSKQEFKNETQSSYFKPTLITKQDVKTEQSSSFKPSLFRPIELTSEKEKEPSFGSDLDFFKDLPTEKVEKSTPKNNAFKSYSHDFDEDVDLDHEFV